MGAAAAGAGKGRQRCVTITLLTRFCLQGVGKWDGHRLGMLQTGGGGCHFGIRLGNLYFI